MKNVFYLLVINITAFSFSLNAQWVPTYLPTNGAVGCFAVSGTNLFTGAWQDLNFPNGGAFLSTNSGSSWTYVGFANTAVVAFAVSGTNLFAGTPEGGVFLTTNNGTSWSAVNNGLTDTIVYSLVVSGTNIFAGTWSGSVFLSTNNGTNWTEVSNGLTNSRVFCLAVSGTNLYAGTSGNGVFLTTNNGANWTAVNNSLTDTNVFSLAVNGTNIFAGTLGGVFLSTNNGTSWTVVNTGLTNTTVGALTVSDTNLFAGTIGGGVFLSTNNGTNWTSINDGLPTNTEVYALLVYNSYLFAGTYNSVWYRPLSEIIPVELTLFTTNIVGNNVQLTWQTATETNNQGFEIYRNGNRIAFVEGKGTTTEMQDYSFTDKELQSGIYNYRLNQIDFDGTQEVVGELTAYLALPEQFSLEQNYPNPFNPSTTIKYSIPTSEFVTLKVYDVLGKEIATLLNEEKPAGAYELYFDASGLTSGVYFYRLHAGSFIETKRMVLLK